MAAVQPLAALYMYYILCAVHIHCVSSLGTADTHSRTVRPNTVNHMHYPESKISSFSRLQERQNTLLSLESRMPGVNLFCTLNSSLSSLSLALSGY